MVAVGLALLMLRADDPIGGGKELPLTTKPLAVVKGLNPKHLVSVSELKMTTNQLVTRVFRYTYRGDYKLIVSEFERSLNKKEGWHMSRSSKTATDFWRVSPTPRLKLQGLIIQSTRLVRNPKSPSGWSSLPQKQGNGWVWVSYNEQTLGSGKQLGNNFSRHVRESKISPLIPVG